MTIKNKLQRFTSSDEQGDTWDVWIDTSEIISVVGPMKIERKATFFKDGYTYWSVRILVRGRSQYTLHLGCKELADNYVKLLVRG